MEKISDEELYYLISKFEDKKNLSNNNLSKGASAEVLNLLQELKARREAVATCKKSLQVEEMIKSLESISGTFLLASVNKNDEIEGRFSGDESKLLSIVDFIFDKLEEASNGEITKQDLIGELLSAEGGRENE